mmetsp:Transcript_7686/g.22962  ORF Transcript_7686/g.22962 Transcript_7686/m.22962 type:complete len:93 (-) Transcript_7686:175-453(-)
MLLQLPLMVLPVLTTEKIPANRVTDEMPATLAARTTRKILRSTILIPTKTSNISKSCKKKQQRTKRWKSSSDDETSDKDNFGQQQRAGVVGN